MQNLDLEKPIVKNLQSYVALDITSTLTGNFHFQADQVIAIDVESDLTDASLGISYKRVKRIYNKHGVKRCSGQE